MGRRLPRQTAQQGPWQQGRAAVGRTPGVLYVTSLDDARPRPATDPETELAVGPAPAHGEQTECVDLEGFRQSGAVMMRPSADVSLVLRAESGRYARRGTSPRV